MIERLTGCANREEREEREMNEFDHIYSKLCLSQLNKRSRSQPAAYETPSYSPSFTHYDAYSIPTVQCTRTAKGTARKRRMTHNVILTVECSLRSLWRRIILSGDKISCFVLSCLFDDRSEEKDSENNETRFCEKETAIEINWKWCRLPSVSVCLKL